MDAKPNQVKLTVNSKESQRETGNLPLQSHSKKKFLAGGQWSQEENTEENCGESSKLNGHALPNSCEEKPPPTSTVTASKPCHPHNNNLVIDKSNLRCSDEKSCQYYIKFPFKVNNNIYPEKSLILKDGMEDYFQQFSSSSEVSALGLKCEDSASNLYSHKSHLNDCFQHENSEHEIISYPDDINPLNGEEEDEDEGCIYTYKGDNYEANLSHLLRTCFSCGLPTTERSGGQNGAISIQRILNGSPHPNPNPQSNLYSPEMDFLEMDFDPGSNGDGGESDCDDNNSILNLDSKVEENSLETFCKLIDTTTSKTNNIPNEIRSLMCEMCASNEQKVNNTSTNLSSKPSSDSNLKSNLQSSLDDRPMSSKAFDKTFSHQNLNVKLELSSDDKNISKSFPSMPQTTTHLTNGKSFIPEKVESRKSSENNLNACQGDFTEEFSDGGDEADDEGGDDSVSDFLPPESNSLFIPSTVGNKETHVEFSSPTTNPKSINSLKTTKHLRFCAQENYAKPQLSQRLTEVGVSNKANMVDPLGHCKRENNSYRDESEATPQNNNLGSVSAPEVSPSKEFSPLEKFTRSLSFQNQLSSPKYENVCFSHPYKNNFPPSVKYQSGSCNSYNYCDCKRASTTCKVSQEPSEITNLEACVDRLTQREKSVFNISSSTSDSSQESANSSNHAHCLLTDGLTSASVNQNLSNGEHSPSQDLLGSLPRKAFHPKVDDPLRDPNTVSDEDLEKEHRVESQTSQVEKVMIWTERQATSRQVSQVGTSACGPTAVINVLLALDHSRPVLVVTSQIRTRLRAEGAPLVDYLLSRSNAGTTHEDLIKGIEAISGGAVKGRFFHMFPKRAFQLSRWLIRWIKKGGVPVATLNLQVGVPHFQTVPDSWHHQMVFGVGPQGIYLTNPLECVSDSLLSDQLCSDSVLMVRRMDIVSRWDQTDKLIRLSLQSDPRWVDMNVLGQVVCVLKEEAAPEMLQGRRHLTSHVTIPASYQSGISIFVRSDNPHIKELLDAPELPLLDE